MEDLQTRATEAAGLRCGVDETGVHLDGSGQHTAHVDIAVH
jgi:hypothetical protein